ncbi:MAG: RNA 2',3'-cyclic phosphodiesterase [Pseudomonadota bacterium]
MSSISPSDTQRLFFALWPHDDMRQQLAAVVKAGERWGGRAVATENLHMTLVFLGSITQAQRAFLEQQAERLTLSSFTLWLDHLGHWPKPQVLWLGVPEVPRPLLDLVEALNRAVADCGLRPDDRPYAPHLTLRRKVAKGPRNESIAPLEWSVHDFALVESNTLSSGVEYRVLRTWPLQQASGA